MTNKQPTNNKIREEIRKMCSLTVNSDQWFKRKEMKTIVRKLSPSSRFMSNDPSSSKYTTTENIFPKFVKGWIAQKTTNAHPSRDNLINIHKHLATLEACQATKPNNIQTFSSKVNWKTALISAVNSLPDDTKHWSGNIKGVGAVSINTRGKHDK